ncbi:MAG: DUF4845 domain-containing protein [Candidatus Accumulibacter sp.]|jgi:hypothetical protein|nr:DUF4845 domain-containing protein [Accumulibacter sp.]
MKYQRGVSLSGLIIWGVVLALVGILAAKVVPEVLDFYKIKKIVASTAINAEGKTVAEIRRLYEQYAYVDGITTITPADLDVYKEGGSVVIAFAYEKRIPLFYNISLLIDFQGASSQRLRGE